MKNIYIIALFATLLILAGCIPQQQAQNDTVQENITEQKDHISNSSANTQTQKTETTTSNNFENIKREITILSGDGNIISPEHYDRLSKTLEEFKQQQIGLSDIPTLEQQLETMNPYTPEVKQTYNKPETFDDKLIATLPECTGQTYTVFPVDEYFEITPLGNIGPPGHTLPTEHMYIHVSGGRATTSTVPLKAPGDITIYSISSDSDDIEPSRKEYSIGFAICKDIYGYFNHVKGISTELQKALDDAPCEVFNEGPKDMCSKNIILPVKAGTVIGEAGHLQGNFDFGTYDFRTTHEYANPSRYGDEKATGLGRGKSPHITCPLDMYTGTEKEKAYSKIKRTTEPQCGTTMQDEKGTIQGNWFYENAKSYGPWTQHLAFIHDNNNPSISVVSIGGTITEAGTIKFTPKNIGTETRAFKDVTPDGNTYCYTGEGKNGKVIVKMTTKDEIQIEYQDASSCIVATFNKPTTYKR